MKGNLEQAYAYGHLYTAVKLASPKAESFQINSKL